MNAGRWYPTNTTLANGDALVVSGSIDTTLGENRLPQVFQVANNSWRDLTNAQLALGLYPRMHLAPNGKIFASGMGTTSRYLDTSGTGAWTFVANSSRARDYGSSVMYDNGKVLIMGGGDPPANTAEVIDLNSSTPAWRAVGSMAFARRQLNATILPDGTVLATGGTSGAGFSDPTNAVYAAELWSPTAETWTTMASATVPRLYHSIAALLPDGRLLSTGGNFYNQAEIYEPPYLFKGARPTMTSAPATVSYGQTFFVGTPDATLITQATWIRLSSVTHAFNMDQRFSRLNFSQTSGGLNVTAPSSTNISPPGYYLLFILNGNGVPSVAKIIRIGASSPVPLISSTSPSLVSAGSSGFTLIVNGSNFIPGSVVQWNGSNRTTTYVSSSQITASIPATDVTVAGTAQVAVFNAGGGISNAFNFSIVPNSCATGQFFAEYYNNISLSGTPTFARCETTINYNWGGGGPGNGLSTDNFSVRWTGMFPFNAAPYTFTATADDGIRLWLDGNQIIDAWKDQAPTTYQATRTLSAADHLIKVEYYEKGGGAVAQVTWQEPTNPIPAIATINPSSALPGGNALTLTVNGSNFVSGAEVRWNGTPRSTTFVSATQLSAAISASDIATTGTAQITVFNPAPGGGTSNTVSFAIATPPASCPTGQFLAEYFNNITLGGSASYTACQGSINYNWGGAGPGNGIGNDNFSARWTGTFSLNAGSYAFTATADDGIRVWVDGSLIIDAWRDQAPTTYQATRTLSTGDHQVKVEYYEKGGGAVAQVSWVSTTPIPGSLQFSSSAYSVNEIGGNATVTVTRTGGSNGAVSVSFATSNGSATAGSDYTATTQAVNFVDGDTADKTVTIPIIDNTSYAGNKTVNLSLTSPSGGATLGSPNTAVLTIVDNESPNPAPVLTNLVPTSTTAGGAGISLTVNGSNFTTSSSVNWNGNSRTTTFMSSTQLTAAITSSDTSAAGTAQVTVVTPAPGGGTSNTQSFTIDPAPAGTLQFSAPTYSATENGGNAIIMITRTGGSAGLVSSTFGTSNGTATAGYDYTATSQVVSFADGDTTSKSVSVAIQDDGSVEGNETINLTLTNPTGGATLGSPSSAVLTIIDDDSPPNPTPSLTSLSPNSVIAGGSAFTLTVNGSNFVSGSVVQLNGASRTTTFVNSSQVTASIPASDFPIAGAAQITVFNPAPGGGTSVPLGLAITSPPTSCPVGQFFAEYFNNITLSGTPTFSRCETTINYNWGGGGPGNGVTNDNFSVRWTGVFSFNTGPYSFAGTADDGIRVSLDSNVIINGWRDQAPTTYQTIQTLAAGDHLVKVEYYEKGGGAVAQFNWAAYTYPVPTLSTITPTRVTPGASPFTLTVNGGNFAPGSVVRWNGTDRPTTFISSSQLTAAIPSTDVALEGAAQITVFNPSPGGGTSTSMNISIAPPPTSCPVGQYFAEYFNNIALTGSPALVACETAINYNWGGGSPGNGLGTDNFSIRWTGTSSFNAATYTFRATADDGIRVWLDGNLIIDAWKDQAPTTYQATQTLTAGDHTVMVEYYEKGGGAVAQVSW